MRQTLMKAVVVLAFLALGAGGGIAQDAGSPADIAFWNSVKDSRSAAEVQAYIDKFPNGTFVELAKLRIKSLQAPASATRTTSPSPSPSPSPSASPTTLAPAAASDPASARPVTSDVIRMVQEKLYNLNYDIAARDGRMNAETREAISAWRRVTKSSVTGDLTSAEIAFLNDVVPPKIWGGAGYNARGGVSTNWNATSRGEAEKKALDGCKKLSGGNCKVLTTAGTRCIAVSFATGTPRTTTYFDAYAIGRTTLAEATDEALSACRTKSRVPANCGIRATLCADGSHKK